MRFVQLARSGPGWGLLLLLGCAEPGGDLAWRVQAGALSGASVLGAAYDFGVVEAADVREQSEPDLACQGDRCLLVFVDGTRFDQQRRIYGARYDLAARRLIDRTGLFLAAGGLDLSTPRVAVAGDHYLVSWLSEGDRQLHALRVDGVSGTVLDPTPILVAADAAPPAVASDGQDFLVAFARGNGVRGVRVSAAGQVLDPNGFLIGGGPSAGGPVLAAFVGGYYAVYEETRDPARGVDLFGARVGSDGRVLDPSGQALSLNPGDQRHAAIATNGGEVFVAFEDHSGASVDLYGTRISSDGSARDGSGFAMTTGGGDELQPTVVLGGAQVLVVYQTPSAGGTSLKSVVLASAAAQLRVTGEAEVSGPGERSGPRLALGTTPLLVWGDQRDPGPGIFGVPLDLGSGAPAEAEASLTSLSLPQQHYPRVANNGDVALVVWNDARHGSYDLYGARLRLSDGVILDPEGIPICTAAWDQRVYSVASNGRDFLVTWSDERESRDPNGAIRSYAARVSGANGAVLDPDGFVLSNAEIPIAAAFGEDYLVLLRGSDLYAKRVRARDGMVFEAQALGAQGRPHTYALAANDQIFVAVWSEQSSDGTYDLYATSIRPSDGVVTLFGGFPVSTAYNTQNFPELASNGHDFYLTWSDQRVRGAFDLFGARLSADFVLQDPEGLPLSTAPYQQLHSHVVWAGDRWLASWQDDRDGKLEIYGAQIDPATGLVLGQEALWSPEPGQQYFPILSATPGDPLLVYVDGLTRTPRIKARFYGDQPLGPPPLDGGGRPSGDAGLMGPRPDAGAPSPPPTSVDGGEPFEPLPDAGRPGNGQGGPGVGREDARGGCRCVDRPSGELLGAGLLGWLALALLLMRRPAGPVRKRR